MENRFKERNSKYLISVFVIKASKSMVITSINPYKRTELLCYKQYVSSNEIMIAWWEAGCRIGITDL
jgi:hypothetical protein